MKVLHGTWIPSSETSFIQTGTFSLWIETSFQKNRKTPTSTIHPGHLTQDDLATFLVKQLGLSENSTTLKSQNTQSFKQVILKDQYIPALKYRESPLPKGKRKKNTPNFEIYPGWEIVSSAYEERIHQYVDYMPLACVSGFATKQESIEFYNRETLLRHFSECLLTELVTNTTLTASFDKKISKSFLHSCTYLQSQQPSINQHTLEDYQQWAAWKQKLIGVQDNAAFHLCFQLESASIDAPENWQLNFMVASKKDPSLKLDLDNYWTSNQKAKKSIHQQFGEEFEKDLLLNLGYAARMYPKIWEGLETHQPIGLQLTLDEAFGFLKESAWILEDAGYKVIVPAWWTPEGRQRAKIRLKASPKKSATKSKNQGYFSLNTIIQYQYELSLGGQSITKQEWQQLVNAKTPLIQFRGQWVELDQEKMQKMLEFWQSHSQETPEMTLIDLLKKATEAEDEIEIEHDDLLADMIAKLQDKSQLEPIDNPQQLQGTLREYQKRGVSWLQYLEKLGLNGCLADDMGLGKSIQVIAQLINEKESNQEVSPTLLIAPTSTKEQASLYEAIVKDVAQQLEEAEGIQRKGLIVSTLMKLKQVCNHPAQFLQDSSEFTPERSHKLERLAEMIEEVNAEGESLLIFTQFTEIGGNLEKYLKQTFHYNTYYLHGGTSRNKREKMIAEFQDPDSEPSVFILSLKAGGVGITLTKANHVFHFDRWWNPAVEDQATDRAFRIGQKKMFLSINL